ncbi:MAG: YggS family pyridoxal phosphate-dependent enzyme [Bacteroidia bacterium]|jgi:pyridoxal phosphate enzyme (YggS family)|nr:YggS family pyridoxal phosphate-dependent enzyme [Bacteroidia bacterium]
MSIAANIEKIKQQLSQNIKLIAVSKTKPVETLMEAYNSGQKIFGENKVQELVSKFEQMPKDIEWHMIGHLQSNKVKYIIPFVALIHSVDSENILLEINKQAAKINKIQQVLLQISIADEETKFGFEEAELFNILEKYNNQEFPNIEIVGLMGMATFTDNKEQIANEFSRLKKLFDNVKSNYFSTQESFNQLSMGMSSDYEIAIANGSNLIRVGSNIFGSR